MSESQSQVLTLIEAVAKRRGEPVHDFMDSRSAGEPDTTL